jgi:hypothetical protein
MIRPVRPGTENLRKSSPAIGPPPVAPAVTPSGTELFYLAEHHTLSGQAGDPNGRPGLRPPL